MCATRAKNSVLRASLTRGWGAHAGGPNSSLVLGLGLLLLLVLDAVEAVGMVTSVADPGDESRPMLTPLLLLIVLVGDVSAPVSVWVSPGAGKVVPAALCR